MRVPSLQSHLRQRLHWLRILALAVVGLSAGQLLAPQVTSAVQLLADEDPGEDGEEAQPLAADDAAESPDWYIQHRVPLRTAHLRMDARDRLRTPHALAVRAARRIRLLRPTNSDACLPYRPTHVVRLLI
jgi:hypothetical protein